MATATVEKDAYKLAEAAARTPFSTKVIRQAIHATDPAAWPPPLRAKVTSRNSDGTPRSYVVLAKDLEQWLEGLPDA